MQLLKATAFVPATFANVAVGFDILGFALKSLGESATVELIPGKRKISIDPIAGYPELSLDPRANTATAGLLQLMDDKKLQHGFHASLKKLFQLNPASAAHRLRRWRQLLPRVAS